MPLGLGGSAFYAQVLWLFATTRPLAACFFTTSTTLTICSVFKANCVLQVHTLSSKFAEPSPLSLHSSFSSSTAPLLLTHLSTVARPSNLHLLCPAKQSLDFRLYQGLCCSGRFLRGLKWKGSEGPLRQKFFKVEAGHQYNFFLSKATKQFD